MKKQLESARGDAENMRASLVSAIAGPSANAKSFKNVSLDGMFRIYQKQVSEGGSGNKLGGTRRGSSRRSVRPSSRASGSPPGTPDSAGGSGGGAPSGGSDAGGKADEDGPDALHQVLAAEREAQSLKAYVAAWLDTLCRRRSHVRFASHNRKLHERVESLEEELQHARNVARNVHGAKAKVSDMANRARKEKQGRLRAEDEVRRGMEKVEALMEHIEKLMVHLKHEAAAKAKAFDAQRRGTRLHMVSCGCNLGALTGCVRQLSETFSC